MPNSLPLLAALVLALAPEAGWAQRVSAPSQVASPPPPAPTPSGQRLSLSLAEAIALGLRDNRTIRSAYLERIAQKFDLTVAERRFVPRLDIAAQASNERLDGETIDHLSLAPTATWLTPTGASLRFSWARVTDRPDGGRTAGSEVSSLTIDQPLLRGAGLAVNLAPIRGARLQEQINQLALKATVSDTVTAIVLTYRALAQAQAQVKLAEASLARTNDLLETNRALIQAGRMAAADIVQAESGLANQQVALLQAQQQQASAQVALLRLLAVDQHTNVVAGDAIAAEHVDIDLDRVIALGLDNRMDVLAQRKALEQSRLALMLARNDRLWDVSVFGGVQNRRDVGGLSGDPDLGDSRLLGVQVAIPLGDFTARQAVIRSDINLRTSTLRLEELQQGVEAQVRDATQAVESNWRQLEAARRAKTLSAQAVDIAREKLKAGRASNFEVLSMQADLRAADTQELSAAIAYLNALTILDQQLGSTLDTWRIALND